MEKQKTTREKKKEKERGGENKKKRGGRSRLFMLLQVFWHFSRKVSYTFALYDRDSQKYG